MESELRNQTLVAAAAAKQQGFENTYRALIEIVRELENSKVAVASRCESVSA
ncbi:hypothetical protein [uncultured Tateyamaria sp.]|uniref:hypothetical protein n=1 Tax=uncultured Tateyamaria sp. TaxID=455651 RepID=UPI00261F0EB0|nr:hypothetical protein [uncultured Tateyamaria sp.]